MNVILLITVLVVILILVFVGYMMFREKRVRKVGVSENESDGGGGCERVSEKEKHGFRKWWGRGGASNDDEGGIQDEHNVMNKFQRRLSLTHNSEREATHTPHEEEEEDSNNNYPSFSEQINSPVNFDTSLLEVVDTSSSSSQGQSQPPQPQPQHPQQPKITFEKSTPIF